MIVNRVFLACVLSAATGLAGVFPASLIDSLKLTPVQVQSIVDLNNAFTAAQAPAGKQVTDLQAAIADLVKQTPRDAVAIGSAYARIEMLRRAFTAQKAKLQADIAAVLTADQAKLVNGLVDAARLREIVFDADVFGLVDVPASAITVPTGAYRIGNFVSTIGYQSPNFVRPVDIALVNYLQLTEAQIAVIENAYATYSAYADRQDLRIQELRNDITALTAAPDLDAAKLGAEYVAIAEIQDDESAQAKQLATTVRGVLTPDQQPRLLTLDDAAARLPALADGICNNVVVLPADVPDVASGYYWFNVPAFAGNFASFLLGPVPSCAPATDVPAS